MGFLLPERRHGMTKEDFQKAEAPGEAVLLERKVKYRAKKTLRELCESVVCLLASPVCKKFKSVSGCKVGDKCPLRHTEADSQPSAKSKRSGGKGQLLC